MPFLKTARSIVAAVMIPLICSLGFPEASRAAAASGIAATGITGTWGVRLATRYQITEFGRRKFNDSGNCTVTLLDNLHAGFSCAGFSDQLGQNYSGGISVFIRRSRLGWSLDSAGLDQAVSNMTALLIARNEKRGNPLQPGDVSFEFDQIKYHPITLSKKLSQPERAIGLIKGRAIQLINGRYVVKPFTYRLEISFLARIR